VVTPNSCVKPPPNWHRWLLNTMASSAGGQGDAYFHPNHHQHHYYSIIIHRNTPSLLQHLLQLLKLPRRQLNKQLDHPSERFLILKGPQHGPHALTVATVLLDYAAVLRRGRRRVSLYNRIAGGSDVHVVGCGKALSSHGPYRGSTICPCL